MSEGFSLEAVLSFLRRNLFLTGVSITGLILLGFGFFGLESFSVPKEASVVYESADPGASDQAGVTPQSSQGEQSGTIFVDISGAVMKPGVYELRSDARVQDVLSKAGGLDAKADHVGIARSVNLAAKIADGMKLYFPFKGEKGAESALVSAQSNELNDTAIGGSTVTNGLINLNLSSSSELESLPGIGTVTAQKIIKGRPYGSVQDIKDKKIVGESVYGKIKELVTVN